MASTTSKKIGNLYAKLGAKEIRRMQAKLTREHNPDEMNRLGQAIAQEHARFYNDGLKLLRVLNGNTLDWVGLARLGMERDRVRFQALLREVVIDNVLRHQLIEMWRFIKYPVTESEYQTILRRQRNEPLSLDGYAEMLAEIDEDEPGLHPAIAEYLDNLPPELERLYIDDETPERGSPEYEAFAQESKRRYDAIEKGMRAIIDDAIKKGEIPKPKRKDGELSLPWGVLSDWAEGTTEDTFDIGGPGSGDHVPMLMMFQGLLGPEWDIHPDSDADFVKEERRQMLQRLPMLPTIPREVRDIIGTLDPPLTEKERQQDLEHVQTLREMWYSQNGLAELMLDAATSHAEHRAQLAGLREAVDILQRDEFYGEDPLFPEIRAHMESAQEEAERFPALWEQANSVHPDIRWLLYEVQGLELEPEDWRRADNDELKKPAPFPDKAPETEEMLSLIRAWEAS